MYCVKFPVDYFEKINIFNFHVQHMKRLKKIFNNCKGKLKYLNQI